MKKHATHAEDGATISRREAPMQTTTDVLSPCPTCGGPATAALNARRGCGCGVTHASPEAAAKCRAMHTARTLARRVFEKRGNHSEAHVAEPELAALLALACEIAAGLR